ncbi:MAG: hypothetical protein WAT19_09800 [Ferruginibacter sp.]
MQFIKKMLVAFSLSVMLFSCIDIEEFITIMDDSSGRYAFTIDMGGMLEFSKSMGEGKNKKKEKKDTVINFRDLMKGEVSLTDHEKELFRDASLKVNMDEEKGEGKMLLQCPFKNMNDLVEVKNNLMIVTKKLKAFEKAEGKNKDQEPEEEVDGEKLLTPGKSENHIFTAKPGSLQLAVLNPEMIKKQLESDSSNAMMQQMIALMGEIKYKTIIETPKPVKNHQGNGAILSADKRRISFITSFTEMYEAPEKLGFLVEY